MFVEVSAKKKLHIDDLLETILLQADVLELKANPDALASGFVIEANLDKGRGPVATVLVQRGTLHPGDAVVAGTSYGRVRALVDPRGSTSTRRRPSDPVEILGLNSVPTAGDEFRVFEDERDARKLAEERALRARLAEQETKAHMSLDDLFSRIEEGKQTDLNLIVKADVQGSIEALRDAFDKMDQSEVRINIVHSAVGGITETDVTLAAASDAIIIGFNVRPTGKSASRPRRRRWTSACTASSTRPSRTSTPRAWVCCRRRSWRRTPASPRCARPSRCRRWAPSPAATSSTARSTATTRCASCATAPSSSRASMASLRRFKDDVKSVKQGYECGIGIDGYPGPQGGRHYRGLHGQGSRAHRVIELSRPAEAERARRSKGLRHSIRFRRRERLRTRRGDGADSTPGPLLATFRGAGSRLHVS